MKRATGWRPQLNHTFPYIPNRVLTITEPEMIALYINVRTTCTCTNHIVCRWFDIDVCCTPCTYIHAGIVYRVVTTLMYAYHYIACFRIAL